MEHDTEDTIIRPARGEEGVRALLDDDTVIRPRQAPGSTLPRTIAAEQPPVLAPPALEPPPVEPPALVEAPPEPPPIVPNWYRFTVNSHEPIGLDRPALIGRRPSLPRVPLVARPRLVRVPSPLQEVSGTHLELRQKGSSVVVTDYRSTNGTVVVLPGSLPRKLRPGESIVATPGSVIDIGDGNRIEILPVQITGWPSSAVTMNERPTL
ncbi:FHA domain-containing protein [Homoserinimonas aerilata]|uniref:FHA domain-containing protein n=1 Tax=Homoserinimonas aerilata TaxID=1162970 RepID=A0A542YK99_9MICO|nr:FHA domain-containing protein [Homoserinimonas aerilata]TQL48491.1 FHA domain-containing protein [Homoserinimonas aerilata]